MVELDHELASELSADPAPATKTIAHRRKGRQIVAGTGKGFVVVGGGPVPEFSQHPPKRLAAGLLAPLPTVGAPVLSGRHAGRSERGVPATQPV